MQTNIKTKLQAEWGYILCLHGAFLRGNKNIKITVEIKSMLQEYILLSIN